VSKERKRAYRRFKSDGDMSKERKCSPWLLRFGDGGSKNLGVLTDYLNMVVVCQRSLSVLTDYLNQVVICQRNLNVLTDYLNLVMMCQGNPETKKNVNEAERLPFGNYKID
jgi:hypothetical protein